MVWTDWVQLVPSLIAVAGAGWGVWQWLQRRRERWLRRQLSELGVTMHGAARDAAVARQQLQPNGGADRPDPSTHDLALGTYRQLQTHIAAPDAHGREG